MYISVPNVANIVVRLGLLSGKFDYTEDDTFKSRLMAVMLGLLAIKHMVVARVAVPEPKQPGV